jgi:hypothetical protein
MKELIAGFKGHNGNRLQPGDNHEAFVAVFAKYRIFR